MPSFTTEQLAAIETRDTDLLVSAAAGSGKTTVLVERVLGLIRDGMPVDRLLIVTFTRAAAADMRAKLQKRLESLSAEEPALHEQLDRLPLATIGTLHSFCTALMRDQFEAAGVDPSFRILEAGESDREIDEAVRAAINDVYALNGEGLASLQCSRSTDTVAAIAKQLYFAVTARPDGEEWLTDCSENCADPSRAEKIASLLAEDCRATLRLSAELLETALDYAQMPNGPAHYIPCLESDISILRSAAGLPAEQLFTFDPVLTRAPGGRGPKDMDPALKERMSKARDKASDLLKTVKGKLAVAARVPEDLRDLRAPLCVLADIVRGLDRRLNELHDTRSAYSFADLERRAIRVMRDPDAARAVRDRYDAVFVDEYQDISDVQETLIRLTAKPGTLFMVGDVKQSIYRFRQAEPGLFLEKQRAFEAHEGGTLIRLNRNFRSRARLLEFINRVFAACMCGEGSEIEYTEDEALHPGAQFPGEDAPVELYLIDAGDRTAPDTSGEPEDGSGANDDTETVTPADAMEGLLTAQRVRALLGTPVSDGKGGTRPAQYRDIVILGRTRARLLKVRNILEDEGIPCFADTGSSFSEAMEIRHVLSLLRLIENGQSDIDLLAWLLSPVSRFTPEDIAEIRIRCGSNESTMLEACRRVSVDSDDLGRRLLRFFTELRRWRLLSRTTPLEEFIDRFLHETGFYLYVGALSGGDRRRANLDLLCTKAAAYSASHYDGLGGFLESFTLPKGSQDAAGEAQPLGEGEDVVRLMTVHRSKGLEFPIVIGIQMDRSCARGGAGMELKTHKSLGFSLDIHDPVARTKRKSSLAGAIGAVEQLESVNEEMRLLYVLMTRASERLVLIGRSSRLDSDMAAWQTGSDIHTRRRWMDMIAPSVQGFAEQGTFDTYSLCIVRGSELKARAAESDDLSIARTALLDSILQDSSPVSEELAAAFTWVYPYQEDVLSPLKMTVTALSREVIGPAVRTAAEQKPRFLSPETGRAMERGTAVHNALAYMDREALRASGETTAAAVEAELDRLCGMHVLSEDARAQIRSDLLIRFLAGTFGQRMLRAEVCKREWAFNLRMPAREALDFTAAGTDMLVQGVIDCCFLEGGQWVLYDYKTDYAETEQEIVDRYAPQLRLYRRALETITGIPVKETRLVLLRMRSAPEID